jgi:hypothetical protein
MSCVALPEFTWPPVCDGPHDYQEHEHAHLPESLAGIAPKWRPSDRCSARYWCRQCKRWSDGPNCLQVTAA